MFRTIAVLVATIAFATAQNSSSSSSSSSSGSGSASGSMMGFQCLAQPLESDDGALQPPMMGMSRAGFGDSAADTCPENVTQCVVLMFLDEKVEDSNDKIVTGGCYNPMAPWIISQEIMCEPGDDSIKVSLDGSFIYTCCDGGMCNTGALLDVDDARDLYDPDCESMDAKECVDDYIETYGCLLENVRITKPGEDDECARFLRPGVSCLKAACGACEDECMRPAGPSSECKDKCKGSMLKTTDDYVEPGCYGMDIANGECDIFCMVPDALFDGGDCNGDGPGRARNHLLKLLARFDDNMDGVLSLDEAMYLEVDDAPPISPEMFEMYNFDMNMGLDWYELGLLLRKTVPLDDPRKSDEPLPTFMEEVAINIVQLVDKNLNGMASLRELNKLFSITPDQFEMITDEEEATMLQVMKTLNVVSNGLMGINEIDKVDVKAASMIAVGLADYSGDGKMSLGESKLLRLSRRMFEEIDDNEDGMVSGDELYGAIKKAGEYGCMGFRALDMQDGDFEFKAAPLRFPDATCNILVLPEWNYEKAEAEYSPPPRSAASSLRRKRTVRPRPPTLRNREQLHSLTRRKAMLEVKQTSSKDKEANERAAKAISERLARLLSPRHVNRRLLQMVALPPLVEEEEMEMPFDAMRVDPDVKYPFLVALETPQRICGFDEYLPEDYCAVPPWMVWEDIERAGLADPEGLAFDMTCLAKDAFDAAVMLAGGPDGKLSEDDLIAKAYEELQEAFVEVTSMPASFPGLSLFTGPEGYAQFQAVAELLLPMGPAYPVSLPVTVCQEEVDLDDYWWAVLTTGAAPSSSSSSSSASMSSGSGSMSGSALPEGCVAGATISENLGAITDANGVTLGEYMATLIQAFLGCESSSSASGSGSMGGSAPRRRLFSAPRDAPMEVEYEDMYQYCSGTLIDKYWVLTAAFCVSDGVGSVIEHDVVRVGGKNSTSGGKFRIEKVLVHPGFKTVGHAMWDMREFDAALIKLSEPVEDILPVRLYDGMDLGYSDCHQLAVKALGFPERGERGGAELEWTTNDECDEEKMEELGYKGSVTPNMLCAINDDDDEDRPYMDLGGPLVAKPNDLVVDVAYLLVGITSTKESQRHFFTRVSKIRQWALAVMGRHPMKDMSVVINELELGDDTELEWFAWPSHTAPCPDDECEIEECDIETGVYRDMGRGALTFSIEGGADWEISAELSSKGCGTECSDTQRRHELMGCPPPREEEDEDDEEAPPACVPCMLSLRWENITELARKGKAFTGGLGDRAVHTFQKKYGVWACVRDWDVMEQLACGAKPGEMACFRFNEKEGGKFDFYGMNEELLLVTEHQAKDAMDKQLDMLATLMD